MWVCTWARARVQYLVAVSLSVSSDIPRHNKSAVRPHNRSAVCMWEEKKGGGGGEGGAYSPCYQTPPMASALCEWAPYEVTHCGPFSPELPRG